MSGYADGADEQDRPVVARAAGANQTGILLNFHNSAGLNVSGVEFVGAEVGLGFTFDAAAAPPPQGGYSNFTIEDCVFRLQQGVYYTPSSGSWWGSAIAFAREGGVGVTASSVRVAHCAFVGCDQAYTNNLPQPSFPPDEWTRAFVDGLDVSEGICVPAPLQPSLHRCRLPTQFASNAMVSDSYNVLFLDTTTAVSVRDNVFLRDTPPQVRNDEQKNDLGPSRDTPPQIRLGCGTHHPGDEVNAPRLRLRLCSSSSPERRTSSWGSSTPHAA